MALPLVLLALSGCDGAGGVDAGPLPSDDSGVDAGAAACTAGDTRTSICGMCGMVGQTCSSTGEWEDTSECLAQGECLEGSVETRDMPLCALEQRVCTASCEWSDWEVVEPEGDCEPGQRRTSGELCSAGLERDETCSATCEWEGDTVCADACGGTAAIRATPEWEREVCIPEGMFFRGSMSQPGSRTQPVREVFISSFYIDAYPVTNRRYQQCVDAGACSSPTGPYARLTPEFSDFAVQGITQSMAADFCAWDGGRRLPTGGEWEKAARGPSPRMNDYLWGDTWDCAAAPLDPCPGYTPPPPYDTEFFLVRFAYDAHPGASSYYGVMHQGYAVTEWVRDNWCDFLYADPTAISDPVCTASSPSGYPDLAEVRSVQRREFQTFAYRDSRALGHAFNNGFRCARSP